MNHGCLLPLSPVHSKKPDAGIRQRVRLNADRNIGLSATVSARALNVARTSLSGFPSECPGGHGRSISPTPPPKEGPWTKYAPPRNGGSVNFDDLIPSGKDQSRQGARGERVSFDDLIPQNRVQQGHQVGRQQRFNPELQSALDQKAHPGLTRNVAAGLNSALYATAGAPVDAMTWALNKGIGGINAATGGWAL
jgi:hypothetical protein